MSTPRATRPPRQAASVILCRNPADLEVFWVVRRPELAFLGGFHSFPGGRLSREDEAAAAEWSGAGASDASTEVKVGLPALPGGAFQDAALRICGLRELEEETEIGVRKDGAFDLAALVPAGRWVTPPFSPARFDTVFYLAWAPDGAAPRVANTELLEGSWIRPEDALDLWSAGKALLAPPTLYALRGLYAAALQSDGEDDALALTAVAEHLVGAPEAAGGDVTRIEMRPGFFLFPQETRTIPPATHTNVFLVGAGDMVLVDPSARDSLGIARLLTFCEQLGAEGRKVAEIWLTHHHPDHVSGAAAAAAALKVPVRAHPETAARLADLGVPVEPVLIDGFTRDLPGRPGWRLKVVHTPGHARGHIAILEEKAGTLIAGDMVAGVGYIMIDPPEGNMADYLGSLERLRGLGASVLFPSHGPPTSGVEKRLTEYIEHRLERESKVLAALADGNPMTTAELLPIVYDDVKPEMFPLAERSLVAHLEKLVEEGRASVSGERYQGR